MRIAPRQAQELAPAQPHVEFAALDVETANSDLASICQIGIATVVAGRISHVWTRLIRPRGRFERRHIEIHGITSDAVAAAPTFPEMYGEIARRLPRLVVTHTRFDVAALTQECHRGRLPVFQRVWLDSSLLPNRAWPGRFPRGSRGLAAIATRLGIEFRHHDAGEDARAAAEITLLGLREAGISVNDWAGKKRVHPRACGGNSWRL